MKHILLLILFSLNCLIGLSQSYSDDPSNAFFRNVDKSFKESSITKNIKESFVPKLEWESVDLSENCCILKHIDGSQYFAGPVKKTYYAVGGKIQADIVRSGEGIIKIISSEGVKYISGTWKRDFLSGDSLVKENDGNIYFCKWKLDKPVENSQREATEEEKIQLQEKIESFEAIIEVSGI